MLFDPEFDEEMIHTLLKSYNELKNNGYSSHFLETEDYEILAGYFLRQSDHQKALEICEVGYQFHHQNTDLLELQSEILYDNKKYNQALELIDNIQSKSNGILPLNTLILKVNILLDQDRLSDAVCLVNDRLHQYHSNDQTAILHELADIYEEELDYKSVFDTLVRILEVQPLEDEALLKFAYWAELADRLEEAENIQRRLLAQYPMHCIIWYNLGSILHTLKRYDEAVEAYQYAIDLDDKFESAYRNMADIYMKRRDYQGAIDILNEYLSIGRPEDVVFEALGDCYTKIKNYDLARKYFQDAIQINPNDGALHFKLGITYTAQDNHPQAIIAYKRAFELTPDSFEYLCTIANTLVLMEDYPQALKMYYNSIMLKDNYKPAWIGVVGLLYELGMYDEALISAGNALDLCNAKSEFAMYEVAINIRLGRIKEAILLLEIANSKKQIKTKLLITLIPDLLQRKEFALIINDNKRGKNKN